VRVANRATPSLRPRPLSATNGTAAKPFYSITLLSIGFRASSFAFLSPAFLEATFPWAAFESCKPTCRRLTLRLALPRRFPQKPAIGRLAATVFGHKQGNKLGRPKQRTWRAIWSQGASFAALTSGALGGLVEIEVGMERCGVARRSGGGARPSDRGCPNLKFRGCRRTTAATSTASGRRSHRMPDGPLGLQRLCGSESSSGDNHVGP
jgi:hypothetical protein